jgi:hypothetical protein
MLSSRHFFSAYAFRQRIKSPVEFVLGAVRSVYREFDAKDKNHRPLTQQDLVAPIDSMGQLLFAPPNVKGWRGAKAWLNTATMLARDNFAQSLAMGRIWGTGVIRGTDDMLEIDLAVPEPPGANPPQPPKSTDQPEEPAPPNAVDPARIIHEEKVTSPGEIVRLLLDAYLLGGLSPSAEAKLVAFVQAGNPRGPMLDRRVRETVHALLTMPEYQLA